MARLVCYTECVARLVLSAIRSAWLVLPCLPYGVLSTVRDWEIAATSVRDWEIAATSVRDWEIAATSVRDWEIAARSVRDWEIAATVYDLQFLALIEAQGHASGNILGYVAAPVGPFQRLLWECVTCR